MIDLLVVLGLLAIAAFAAESLSDGQTRRAARRALKRTKRIEIAAMPQDAVTKIAGVITPRADMLTSPIGRQKCIGYKTIVEACAPEGSWHPVLNSADCASFYLTDTSGRAVVEGPIIIAGYADGAWDVPPASLFEASEGEKLRCQEILLKPGDEVSVVGRATLEIDPAGHGSHREPPMLNHVRGTQDEPVAVGFEIDLG